MKTMPFDSAKYQQVCAQFEVPKITPILKTQAMKAGWGKEMDLKLVALEIRKVKLASKAKITEKQRATINMLQSKIDALCPPKVKVVKDDKPIEL